MPAPMDRVRAADAAPDDWDHYVAGAGVEGSFLQSRTWAKINAQIGRATPRFFSVTGADGTAAQALVLERDQLCRLRLGGRALLPHLQCQGGPVVREPADRVWATEALLATVVRRGRRCLATHVTFVPCPLSASLADERVGAVYAHHGFTGRTWATYLVNLQLSADDLLARLRPAARKAIRRGETMELRLVEATTLEDVSGRFFRAYALAESHFGRRPPPFNLPQWTEDRERVYRYYTAEDGDGKVLACLGMCVYNGVATEIMSSLSPEAFEAKIPAQDFLHWQLILQARDLGCHTFDLAGVHPDPVSSGEIGIRRFKEKWGGRYVEYPVYRRDLLPAWGRLMAWGRRLRFRPARGHVSKGARP